MKKIILPTMALTLISLLFIRCNAENMQNENLITENATIRYNPAGIDDCVLSVTTENNDFYGLESLSEKFREDDLKVKISYLKTDRLVNCGFGGAPFAIEIEKIEKIK